MKCTALEMNRLKGLNQNLDEAMMVGVPMNSLFFIQEEGNSSLGTWNFHNEADTQGFSSSLSNEFTAQLVDAFS